MKRLIEEGTIQSPSPSSCASRASCLIPSSPVTSLEHVLEVDRFRHRRRVRRRQWGKRLLIAGEWLLTLAVLAAIAYGVWLLRDRIQT